MLSLLPNDYTLPRVQAALAHECNHNVRFQFIKWNQQTTLADWVVSEGLAEFFAAELYGKELIGPWVTSTSSEQLEEIKPHHLKSASANRDGGNGSLSLR